MSGGGWLEWQGGLIGFTLMQCEVMQRVIQWRIKM